jgi:hypothetical protein
MLLSFNVHDAVTLTRGVIVTQAQELAPATFRGARPISGSSESGTMIERAAEIKLVGDWYG